VTSLTIAKGTNVSAPIRYVNRAEAIWGPRAKEFIPERWTGFADGESKHVDTAPLNEKSSEIGIPPSVREIQGHKHLLTFSDGPRTCLGKSFALSEFKVGVSSNLESRS
jgi:cytochrome P450